MKKGKFERVTPAAPVRRRRRRRNSGAKLGLLILAITMLVGSTLGGTLAYLTDTSASVKNTFTVGNIGTLVLTENGTELTEDTVRDSLIVPGVNIVKDVELDYSAEEGAKIKNIDAYVFVTVAMDNGWTRGTDNRTYSFSSNRISWSVDTQWIWLGEYDGESVYYQRVAAAESLTDADIVSGGAVNVSSTITKAEVPTVAAAAGDITFRAYAIQAAGFEDDVAGAWDALNKQ